MKRLAILCGVLMCVAGNAMAADVTVTVHNVNEEGGEVRAAICDKANWLTYNCPYRQHIPAKAGDMQFTFKDIPPGDWAAIADHDANMNGKLDENFLGIPIEQFGFSNNPGFNHKPDFSESVFKLEKSNMDISLDFYK